jgi:hypothetical protein
MIDERLPFQPKGELPEWRMIYERLLETADFGDLITYGMLDEVLGRPFDESRSPFQKARKVLAERRKRQLVVVPRVGYRVVEAREHLDVAADYQRRGQRHLQRMSRVFDTTPVEHLTPAERLLFDRQSIIAYTQLSFMIETNRRFDRHEAILRNAGLIPAGYTELPHHG